MPFSTSIMRQVIGTLLDTPVRRRGDAAGAVSIADIAGGMYAYSGILTALLQRERTGEGTSLEVSLFEALGEWMGYAMYYTMGGTPPARTGASHATIAPYGPYPTSDGQVIFGIQNDLVTRLPGFPVP